MNEIKLRPCPFCGGEAIIHECGIFENDTAKVIFGGRVGVHCSECYIATIPLDNEEVAIETWNRRVGYQKQNEVVKCKDCKYWQDNNNGYPHEECRWGKDETPDADDYCSYGERKE